MCEHLLNGIVYLNRTGCSWRQLPHDFPPWGTTHYYYRRFRLDGTWERVHGKLREKVRRHVDKMPTPSAAVIDSQSVKTAAPQKGGRMVMMRARRSPAESGILSLTR